MSDGAASAGFGTVAPGAAGFGGSRKGEWIRWPIEVAAREMAILMKNGKCLADAREIIRSRQDEPSPEGEIIEL